ncbi:MAG: hypothetical protein OXF41_15660 [bacterium]|nr:hypothetical protein [bacterium]
MLYSSSPLSNTADHPDQVQSGAGERREHRVYLSVHPTLDRTDGWDMVIRSVEDEALRRSGLYPTRGTRRLPPALLSMSWTCTVHSTSPEGLVAALGGGRGWRGP